LAQFGETKIVKKLFSALSLFFIVSACGAHEAVKEKPVDTSITSAGPSASSQSRMPVFVRDIDVAAAPAAAAVDRFSDALKAVDLDTVRELLDPRVLILENGGSERSRDEYFAHHVISDAAFLQTAQVQPRYRKAGIEGDAAWVLTESIIERDNNGKKDLIKSTETMLLRRIKSQWRIIHIHWSSQPLIPD
jgi:ketosteroid isomerase-like protein